MSIYNNNIIGKKVSREGKIIKYRGNTIACMLSENNNVLILAEKVQKEYIKAKFACDFVFLPISSMHMTVFELLCDMVRVKYFWSDNLGLDMEMSLIDSYMKGVFMKVRKPNAIKMKIVKVDVNDVLVIKLSPLNNVVNNELKQYRDNMSKVTGIKFPNHSTYEYHITLAYRYREIDDIVRRELYSFNDFVFEKYGLFDKEIELGAPKLLFFDDMSGFYEDIER